MSVRIKNHIQLHNFGDFLNVLRIQLFSNVVKLSQIVVTQNDRAEIMKVLIIIHNYK